MNANLTAHADATLFDGFQVRHLKAIARDRGLKGYSRLRRAELVELILADDIRIREEIMAANPVEFGVNEYGLTEAQMAQVLADEAKLAEIEPFESPIPSNEGETENVVKVADVVLWHMSDGTAIHGVVRAITDTHFSVRMPVWNATYNLIPTECVKVTGPKSVETLEWLIQCDIESAENEDALLTEVYGHRAEDAGMSFGPFLAHVREHRKAGHVIIGGLWNCCAGNEVAVAVFSDGTKHAVCRACSNAFSGTIEALPIGEHRECMTCGSVHIHETEDAVSTDPIELIQHMIDVLTPAREAARVAWETLGEGVEEFDAYYQAWQDADNAIGEFERTISMIRHGMC